LKMSLILKTPQLGTGLPFKLHDLGI